MVWRGRDNCCARGFDHEEQAGIQGYVIEAQSCELKDGGFTAEFFVEQHDATGVTEKQFHSPNTFTQESPIGKVGSVSRFTTALLR